ncbi:MAG: MBL fold metallo-hydrolase, partial [Spirochaetes bacterium]
MKSGKELIKEIKLTDRGDGYLTVWWLGQHSFAVKHKETLLWLDPFLTPLSGRRVPPLLTPDDIPAGSIIFGSHDHADHIDRPAWEHISEIRTDVTFVVPDILRQRLISDLHITPEVLIGLDDLTQKTIDNVSVTGIAAAHELLTPDPATGQHHYLGFVIEIGGMTIYHSGDTCIYEGLETKLKRWPFFDAVFLPINGRDAKRLKSGCIGNMTYQEAADLAGALRPGIT